MSFNGKYTGSQIDTLLGKANTALQKEEADRLYASKDSGGSSTIPIIRPSSYELDLIPNSIVYWTLDPDGIIIYLPTIPSNDILLECRLLLDCSIDAGPFYIDGDVGIYWETEKPLEEPGYVYDMIFRSFNGGTDWYISYTTYVHHAS